MTRLKTILNKYKETRMARPKHRLDINTDKLYQLAKKVGEGKADMVNNPPHYTQGGMETIDIMEAKSTPEEFKGHLKLTALKYLTRAGHKESELQDAKKTQWYVNRWVKTLEKEAIKFKVIDK
jgi:hypothetical protein